MRPDTQKNIPVPAVSVDRHLECSSALKLLKPLLAPIALRRKLVQGTRRIVVSTVQYACVMLKPLLDPWILTLAGAASR